jgi:arylsulfatase A-like enzyme
VPPDLRQDMEELYEAEILAFDHYFGEFVGQLKAAGIYDQSLIVFLADHGEEFYEHRGWGHGASLYNEIIKVPLLIKFPGNRSAGRIIEKNTANIDVLPTLLDFSAGKIPAGLDGVSLLPLLARENGSEKVFNRLVLSSTSNCKLRETLPAKFAIIFGQYKLIYNYRFSRSELDYYAEAGLPPVDGGMELYDLKNDPGETVNLFPGKMALPAAVKAEITAMIKRLAQNKRLAGGPGPGLDAKEREQLETLGYL